MSRSGRVGGWEATKGADGTWRSSRLWVDQYLSARTRRRTPKAALVFEEEIASRNEDQLGLDV